MSSEAEIRKRKIYRVTFVGFVVNLVLSVLKLAAGIVGRSGAMVADAVHSFSDLATDVVVIAFARISAKPRDDGHDYGHGKYETLATIIISLALGIVGAGILAGSIRDIRIVVDGGLLPRPGQQSAVDHDADVADAAGKNPGPHDPQREAYDDRGEGFVLPVAVIVAVVPGLGGNPREGDHHHIRRQVGERMDGIGHHRSAPPDDSGGKFQHRQHQVDHEPHKGHAVDFTFPDFRFAGHRLKRLKFKNTLFFRLSRN